MAKEEKIIADNATERVFYNYRHRPPQVKFNSKNPSKVQESPLDAKSPQELLDKHGMYIDRPSLKELKPFYADLTQFSSYEQQLNNVRNIKEKFMNLDISIRAKFNHNPEQFCAYLTSPDFDMREIMTADVYAEYEKEQKAIADEKAYKEYLNSDEYKKIVAEQKAKMDEEKRMYEEWKKQFGGTKK